MVTHCDENFLGNWPLQYRIKVPHSVSVQLCILFETLSNYAHSRHNVCPCPFMLILAGTHLTPHELFWPVVVQSYWLGVKLSLPYCCHHPFSLWVHTVDHLYGLWDKMIRSHCTFQTKQSAFFLAWCSSLQGCVSHYLIQTKILLHCIWCLFVP
jgi:hypothetical protein